MENDYTCPNQPFMTYSVLNHYSQYLTDNRDDNETLLSSEVLSESLVGIVQRHLPDCPECREKLDGFLKIIQLLRIGAGNFESARQIRHVRRQICGTE